MRKEIYFLLGIAMLLVAGFGYLFGIISRLTIPVLITFGLIFSGMGATRSKNGGDNRETID